MINSITALLKRVLPIRTYESLARLAQEHVPSLGNYFRFASRDELNDYHSTDIGRLFLNHTGLTVRKWKHYVEIYDDIFSSFRGKEVKFLEIGVAGGGSLQIWRKYFGPESQIIGIDIDPECQSLDEVGQLVRVGSQGDGKFLKSIVNELGRITIVLDDGSHIGEDQVASFVALWPALESGGLYVIEDVHTSFWKEFNPTYPQSFLAQSVALIDSLYSEYARIEPSILTNVVRNSIHSITFYDSIVVIRKGEREEPRRVTFP